MMGTDVLILNNATVDLRSREFGFVEELVGPGGLAKCDLDDMPHYEPAQYRKWIEQGLADPGGPGNSAPLMAHAGLDVAVGSYIGAGNYGGLDARGRFVYDTLADAGVDVSALHVHPSLPTGTTFVCEHEADKRGGLAYFPNANDDFDFETFKEDVIRLDPGVVYYMYSGLSRGGDANGGRDLADFARWCRDRGALTLVDSHTLCADPQKVISSGEPIDQYRLLRPLLPELDLFFTSSDEACMIENTLGEARDWSRLDEAELARHFLRYVADNFLQEDERQRLFGITVTDGAYYTVGSPREGYCDARKVKSRFMAGRAVDLVGAGDAFRAGLLTYFVRHRDQFRGGEAEVDEAIQMGNLFASLYIKAPLHDRCRYIRPYKNMLSAVREDRTYADLDELLAHLESA